jgi:hypothetical protein
MPDGPAHGCGTDPATMCGFPELAMLDEGCIGVCGLRCGSSPPCRAAPFFEGRPAIALGLTSPVSRLNLR